MKLYNANTPTGTECYPLFFADRFHYSPLFGPDKYLFKSNAMYILKVLLLHSAKVEA